MNRRKMRNETHENPIISTHQILAINRSAVREALVAKVGRQARIPRDEKRLELVHLVLYSRLVAFALAVADCVPALEDVRNPCQSENLSKTQTNIRPTEITNMQQENNNKISAHLLSTMRFLLSSHSASTSRIADKNFSGSEKLPTAITK
jgi:hypothetical protein